MPYVQQTWTDNVTPVDKAHMDHIEAGIGTADANATSAGSTANTALAQSLPQPVVSGQWVKGVGGAAVWSAIAVADLPNAIPASKLANYPTDATKGLRGDGSWVGSWSLIQQQVLGAAAPTVSFAVPQTFKHLKLDWTARSDAAFAVGSTNLRFNADASALYDEDYLIVTNSAVSGAQGRAATSIVIGNVVGSTSSAGHWGRGWVEIWDYVSFFHSRACTFESYAKWAAGTNNMQFVKGGGAYENGNAITSLLLFPSGGQFVAASTFTLYGAA